MQHSIETVRREVLTYLARLPKTIQESGNDSLGQIAVQLGNALIWLQPILEPGEPHIEVPLSETPQTIYALGKQLRQVGLHFWDRKKTDVIDRTAEIEAKLKRLELWVSELDENLSRKVAM